MLVDFLVIPHSEQRYDTCGDWWWDHECDVGDDELWQFTEDRDVLHIRVSKMSDPRYELLVFHHEMTEALVCREQGITAEAIDAWDREYEKHRIRPGGFYPVRSLNDNPFKMTCGCDVTATSEPGNDPHGPYHHAHALATACEWLMAAKLGVDWDAYSKEIESL